MVNVLHLIGWEPSTESSMPVMHDGSKNAGKATTLAISSGEPNRWNGIFSSCDLPTRSTTYCGTPSAYVAVAAPTADYVPNDEEKPRKPTEKLPATERLKSVVQAPRL
jgi:hypothetical protein